ncbi:hypothetical protein B0H16DRAFT_1744810 [Mycena metata]|uniref:Uncharacterized protein n=1 Tax=Mycena metata TaxID=1033252 RepID=A0AAD7H576_9AGAR|nr:hypothetical protein B0H16DRAFT_1744810 [Mycena metata]
MTKFSTPPVAALIKPGGLDERLQKQRRRRFPLNDSPRRSARLLQKAAPERKTTGGFVASSPKLEPAPEDNSVQLLRDHVVEYQRLNENLKRHCLDLEVQQLTQKQEVLHQRETQLDEYMLVFEDMSNRRMEADEELRTLQNRLKDSAQMSQEANQAKDLLADLVTKRNEENSDLRERLSITERQLEVVSTQRASLQRQISDLTACRLRESENSYPEICQVYSQGLASQSAI